MATITLEVPDELANQLEDWTTQLPEILAAVIAGRPMPFPQVLWKDHQAWQEAMAFLAEAPGIRSIVDYKLPEHLQDRLEELLYANNAGVITPGEERELDGFIQIIDFFNLLKASLRSTLR